MRREDPVAEFALPWYLATLELRTKQPVPEGFDLVYFLSKATVSGQVIKRDLHNLSADDQRKNHDKVINSMKRELAQWLELESVGIMLKRDATNLVDRTWIFKWKIMVIDGKEQREVKGRWTLRGFKYRQS